MKHEYPDYQTQYKDLLAALLQDGDKRMDRTGVGTTSRFGETLKVWLPDGFPLLPLRKLNFKVAEVELLWMLRGEPHGEFLHKHGVHIWDPWMKTSRVGHEKWLGPVYGVQWRDWGGVDQIDVLLRQLNDTPQSRRMLVSAWNPEEMSAMALPPCPFAFQCWVSSNDELSMVVYQRSADVAVGLPHDVAVYALLTYMLCEQAHLAPGELTFMLGDAHLYRNHLEAANEMIRRENRALPTLMRRYRKGSGDNGIDSYEPGDFYVDGYEPHDAIKLEVAV